MVQIVTGLVTYLLMAIYCHNQYKEKVSIKRVRELSSQILNDPLAEKLQHHRKTNKKRKKKPKTKRAKS